MKKVLLTITVVSVLTVGCKHNDIGLESSIAAPVSTALPPDSSTKPSASPASSPSTVEPAKIEFQEQQADTTVKRITTLIRDYQEKLVEAINTNNFAVVEPLLEPGSSLYNDQKELVANLNKHNIKEHFISSEIYGYYEEEKDHYKVEVTENIQIDYPDRGARLNDYQWFYTVVQVKGKLQLNRIAEWSTYNQDMKQRSGSVKTDGYYAEELLHNFPRILEKAINTQGLTEIRQISGNAAVFEKFKQLITNLCSKGSNFVVQASSVQEDWNTLTSEQKLTFQFTDKDGKKQNVSQTLYVQLDEIRENFQGYAVFGFVSDSKKDITSSNSHSIVSNQIRQIHPSMPEYLFKVYGRAASQKPSSTFNTDKIEIYNAVNKGKLIQEIEIKEAQTWNGRTLGVEFEDMNFDGYLDFRVQAWIPAGPNTPYLYWLWDPKSASFISNTSLEEITSPVFDAKNQTIQSNVRESAASYSDNTYKYINGIPVLVKRIERKADADKKVWHITIKEMLNQQLKVTGQYDEPLSTE